MHFFHREAKNRVLTRHGKQASTIGLDWVIQMVHFHPGREWYNLIHTIHQKCCRWSIQFLSSFPLLLS